MTLTEEKKPIKIRAFVSAIVDLEGLPPETPISEIKSIALNKITASDISLKLDVDNA